MKKILIIEDDHSIALALKALLDASQYEASILKDFEHALSEVKNTLPDLILLDLTLPYINGEILLKNIRQELDIPIIVLTSKTAEVDEVISMSYGADDYITKPYNPTILLLRISALFKRVDKVEETLKYKDAKINISKGLLLKENKEIMLTKNEMLIFSYLLNNQDKIVTRDELITYLWDHTEYVSDNALTVNISRLRNKLEEIGFEDAIETRKGQGYILL
ncbi:MAG: response regulator transcription factor [Bacilli bacterium]|nr:response regulator transcription factor [Bacilli bacterium]